MKDWDPESGNDVGLIVSEVELGSELRIAIQQFNLAT